MTSLADDQTELLDCFILDSDTLKGDSLLRLIDSHTKFDKALDLASEELIAHI